MSYIRKLFNRWREMKAQRRRRKQARKHRVFSRAEASLK
jgi:hypothetical protein